MNKHCLLKYTYPSVLINLLEEILPASAVIKEIILAQLN
jgi:hypothetical protein